MRKVIEHSGAVFNFYKKLSVVQIEVEVYERLCKLAKKAAKDIVKSYDVDTIFSQEFDTEGDKILVTVVMKKKGSKWKRL